MRVILILALCLAITAAAPPKDNRIVGGTIVDIQHYPFAVVMLISATGSGTFYHSCGGSIINNRSILSAAHCFERNGQPWQWRGRVGSNNAHSGGAVHNVNRIINYPQYNEGVTWNNDVAILQVSSTFSFNNNVRAGSIAGPNYNVAENQPVWAIGWGQIASNGPVSEQLRHVEVRYVGLAQCRNSYGQARITNAMLCAGLMGVGGKDACGGDSGGPLLHNNVIVGITSWGNSCALANYPGVYARVSLFSSWIINNA